MKFEIIFYQTLEGKMPVHDFLCSLDTKLRAKTVGMMELLQQHGTICESHTRNTLATEYLNFVANLVVILPEPFIFSIPAEE